MLLPDRSSTVFQSRFLIRGDFSLLIENISEDDEGNYTCRILSDPAQVTNYNVFIEGAVPSRIYTV